jgi:hypothetical protein
MDKLELMKLKSLVSKTLSRESEKTSHRLEKTYLQYPTVLNCF